MGLKLWNDADYANKVLKASEWQRTSDPLVMTRGSSFIQTIVDSSSFGCKSHTEGILSGSASNENPSSSIIPICDAESVTESSEYCNT